MDTGQTELENLFQSFFFFHWKIYDLEKHEPKKKKQIYLRQTININCNNNNKKILFSFPRKKCSLQYNV